MTGPLGDFESPFEAAVAERLRHRGWVVHPQIGVSGFRVDLGIVDPDASGAFLSGVECDGATYHRSASARDRDRLRQGVLEGLGWHILRIWSTDWWTSAARETDRIHRALTERLEAKRALETATRDLGGSEIVEAGPSEGGIDEEGELAPTAVDPEPSVEPTAAGPSGPEGAGTSGAEDGLDPEQFYEDSYRARLAALVAALLDAEGPMRDETLAQRIARAHGFQRTGRRIRDVVQGVLPDGAGVTREGEAIFLWPPGVLPEGWDRFREPAAGTYRDPGDVPMEELCVLARRALRDGMTEEDALIAMRDALGMGRLRETSRQRCLAALYRVRGIRPGSSA